MNKLTTLPLVALLGLGLAACGEDSAVENRAEALEDRADEIEDRVDDVEPMDERMDDMDMDDRDMPMATDDTMTGGMGTDGVNVRLSGFEPTGTIYVALQDESVFGMNDATYGTSVEPMGSSVDAVITGITPGEYALAVFQDTNGNGMLDVGANGVPTEPWYLSNGAGTSGAPNFADAASDYEAGDTEEVQLNSM